MKNVIFIIFIFGFYQTSIGQDSELKIWDYDNIVSDLKSNGRNSKYYPDLNYDGILFLDCDSYSILNEIKPESLLLEKPIESKKIIQQFEVKLKNVTEFFKNRKLFKEITYSLSKETKYDLTNIYIKQPNKGFYTISGTDEDGYYWSNSYGILLQNERLIIDYEYKLVE